MDICGFVLLHCMFRMLRDQNLAPLNCGVSFETLIFLKNSHFIELYKVIGNIYTNSHTTIFSTHFIKTKPIPIQRGTI